MKYDNLYLCSLQEQANLKLITKRAIFNLTNIDGNVRIECYGGFQETVSSTGFAKMILGGKCFGGLLWMEVINEEIEV